MAGDNRHNKGDSNHYGVQYTVPADRERFKAIVIEKLSQGHSVAACARAVGCQRATLYKWRELDPEFAAAWQDARETGADFLEDFALKVATEGIEEPVFGRVARDQDGIVGKINRRSDSILAMLLRASRPEKFRERSEVKAVGHITVEYVSDWRQVDTAIEEPSSDVNERPGE